MGQTLHPCLFFACPRIQTTSKKLLLMNLSAYEACFSQKIRKQRQDAKARKEENQRKSNVTQNISSNATLRKMMKSKKQKKLLQKTDTL